MLIDTLEYNIWFGNVVEIEFIADVMCGFAPFDIYFLFACKSTSDMDMLEYQQEYKSWITDIKKSYKPHSEKKAMFGKFDTGHRYIFWKTFINYSSHEMVFLLNQICCTWISYISYWNLYADYQTIYYMHHLLKPANKEDFILRVIPCIK